MEMETLDCRPGWEALGGGLWLGRRPTLLLVREDGSGGVSSSITGEMCSGYQLGSSSSSSVKFSVCEPECSHILSCR